MSLLGKSFLSSAQLQNTDIDQLFARTKHLKATFAKNGRIDQEINGRDIQQRIIALIFGEPSTRSRTSFQMAISRLGMRSIVLDNMATSSVSKGETVEDTFKNIAAMKPDAMVIRYGGSHETEAVVAELGCPVISAGIGADEHPTQALLDAYTILENRGRLEGEKVLLVGDVLHSRVANSNLILLKKLGATVAYSAPEEFAPNRENWRGVKHFVDLQEGIAWASVVMGLRIQKERHQLEIGLSIAEYRDKYRIGGEQLKHFRQDGILMHPGPVIQGVEISSNVMKDPRNRILDQVTNGVFVRAALLTMILGFEVKNL